MRVTNFLVQEHKVMLVKDLIKQLQELPQDVPVFVQNGGIGDACLGAESDVFFVGNWDGGGICCDMEEGELFVSIFQ